jgi:hypothetical protein
MIFNLPCLMDCKILSRSFSDSTEFIHLPIVWAICESLPAIDGLFLCFAKLSATILEKWSMLLLLKDSIRSHSDAISRIPFVTAKGWAAQETASCRLISSNVSSRVIPAFTSLVRPYAKTCPWLSIVISSAG